MGGLLGGKAPPAAFCSFCRTVGKPFKPIGAGYFLLSFVPINSLASAWKSQMAWPITSAWTNTPSAVDLLVRLIEPAAGFRLVMGPFLLGQAFLGGEPGMGQSQDDPLTRVARASLLKLARLLQDFDAGLPVAARY